ncbi:MAG: aconitase family protein [Candidatus Rokubacteria bacterium]|nr:aconitase family protein [Candidatus Rokubacteria bacterium]
MALTMFEKIWRRHVVAEGLGGHTLLYIDRHLLQEGATHALARLQASGRAVRRPDRTLATADHYVPTTDRTRSIADPEIRGMVEALARDTAAMGIVDLAAQTVTAPDGAIHPFDVDPFLKHGLLTGQDEIAVTLEHAAAIADFEAREARERPWLVAMA